jgi:hypothetical protein
MRFKSISVFLASVLALSACPASADHLAVSFGPSLNGGATPKLVQAGYEYLLTNGSLLATCGAMFEGGETIGTCSALVSARVQTPGGMFTRVGIGPAFITETDSRLSSIFEFNIQGAVGWTQNGWDIGVVYNHYSNAGIWPPNFGRDFLGLLVDIELGSPPPPSAPTAIP